MSIRTIDQIDYRIARLQALMRRLRAERRVVVLREKHRELTRHAAREDHR